MGKLNKKIGILIIVALLLAGGFLYYSLTNYKVSTKSVSCQNLNEYDVQVTSDSECRKFQNILGFQKGMFVDHEEIAFIVSNQYNDFYEDYYHLDPFDSKTLVFKGLDGADVKVNYYMSKSWDGEGEEPSDNLITIYSTFQLIKGDTNIVGLGPNLSFLNDSKENDEAYFKTYINEGLLEKLAKVIK